MMNFTGAGSPGAAGPHHIDARPVRLTFCPGPRVFAPGRANAMTFCQGCVTEMGQFSTEES